MKKIKNKEQILKAVLLCGAFCVSGFFASSQAAMTNIGTGYVNGSVPVLEDWDTTVLNSARNEAKETSIHDANTMRYDKNSRLGDGVLYGSQGGADSEGYSPVSGQYGSVAAMQAAINEMANTSVYVNTIEISPSEILSKEEISSVISKYVGRNILMSDLQDAVDAINDLYAEKGFVTARAYLPEQTVTNGNIKIELIESRIGKVTVTNNKYTTKGYILRRMPEKAGQLFDIVELEKDVLDFNRYHDGVNLSANLSAGETPGTTDIELTASETFPFHLIGMMDNAGRRTTGPLRGGPAIVADSLFHHRDQMSMGAYFSHGAISPFFDYSVPINKKDGRIGFSFSSTFSKVIHGPYNWMNLKSNSYIYSLYYDQPLVRTRGFELRSYAAMNYKRSRTWAHTPIPALDNYLKDTDQVTSFDLGLNMRKDTKRGIWYLNQMATMAFPIFDSDSSYFKYSGGLLRLHDFSHGIIGQLRGSYQIVPNSKYIPYLDQFQIGGLATVRGYSEGVLIGKNGYFFSGELMFPLLPRTITTKDGRVRNFIGNYIKGAVFADTAGVFPWSGTYGYMPGTKGGYFLASVGMGVRVQLPGDLSARLYWGYPLINNWHEQHRHMGRFHFELTLEPDLDGLLARRSTKVQPVVPQEALQEPPAPEPAPNNYDDIRHYDYLLDGGATSL